MPPRYIHDGKAGMAEGGISVNMDAPVIGASMRQGVQHSLNGFYISDADASGYTAHT